MALSEQSTLAESSEGVFYYTTGSVTYQWVQQSLFLEVEVSPFIFRFTEEVKMIQILVQNDGMFVKTPSFLL